VIGGQPERVIDIDDDGVGLAGRDRFAGVEQARIE
jgi:hypothetical protein